MPNWGSSARPAISSRLPAASGDQHADLAVVRRGRGQQVAGGGPDRNGVGQAQPHQAALGLVGDPVAAELGDHRVADDVGRLGRRAGIGHHPLGRHGHAVLG
jgi:hypothetical protein